ncbi:hypothetical protein ALC57_00702 [Trachymyrmex cornetzi]|uniref:Uncharacterized protein n=1 Tax=Trachymyrmex cornetzi TaxID=471704 RepID=A0A151JRQ2_9HYME|nr:hypothetical protein ALC57_00702 [Trachymyrmex cornetzi]
MYTCESCESGDSLHGTGHSKTSRRTAGGTDGTDGRTVAFLLHGGELRSESHGHEVRSEPPPRPPPPPFRLLLHSPDLVTAECLLRTQHGFSEKEREASKYRAIPSFGILYFLAPRSIPLTLPIQKGSLPEPAMPRCGVLRRAVPCRVAVRFAVPSSAE